MRIGVDLGGSKIEAIALAANGSVLDRRRVVTPHGDYDETLRTIRALIEDMEQELGQRGTVGIGTPGAISPATGLLKNSNSVCLNGRPISRDLTALLDRPLRFANDADCFALSEAMDGGAAGAPTVFGVILGTGVGGGIVVHGRIVHGPNAIAGEWGHNPIPGPSASEWPGPPCYCGRTGCIETFLSGPGFSADHARTTGESLEPREILARALSGDPRAEECVARYEERLARSLASVINILDPNTIVLGGGMSNVSRLYERIPRLWSRWVFSDRVDTRLAAPIHGDSSGVRGAAFLWPPSRGTSDV